jgi:hypothetical protein
MAEYVTIRVKVVKEFDDLDRTRWGSRYLGQFGENDNPRFVLFDDEDIVGNEEK